MSLGFPSFFLDTKIIFVTSYRARRSCLIYPQCISPESFQSTLLFILFFPQVFTEHLRGTRVYAKPWGRSSEHASPGSCPHVVYNPMVLRISNAQNHWPLSSYSPADPQDLYATSGYGDTGVGYGTNETRVQILAFTFPNRATLNKHLNLPES